MVRVPVQTIVLDVPPQGAITKDNVTLSVDAVVHFRGHRPVKAVTNVENRLGVISQVAPTSLRSVIGLADLDTMLSDREQLNSELRAAVDTPTDDWGTDQDSTLVISLPAELLRFFEERHRHNRWRVRPSPRPAAPPLSTPAATPAPVDAASWPREATAIT
jgi:regulator of protease activity HflC (stomatin/prohibitin superfamily)